jgi:hypothetical protein
MVKIKFIIKTWISITKESKNKSLKDKNIILLLHCEYNVVIYIEIIIRSTVIARIKYLLPLLYFVI